MRKQKKNTHTHARACTCKRVRRAITHIQWNWIVHFRSHQTQSGALISKNAACRFSHYFVGVQFSQWQFNWVVRPCHKCRGTQNEIKAHTLIRNGTRLLCAHFRETRVRRVSPFRVNAASYPVRLSVVCTCAVAVMCCNVKQQWAEKNVLHMRYIIDGFGVCLSAQTHTHTRARACATCKTARGKICDVRVIKTMHN